MASQQKFEVAAYRSNKQLVANKENDIYVKRLELVRNVCQSYNSMNYLKQLVPTGLIWSYGYPEGLHYCIVPKVGCTYWKSIFRFLNNAIPQNQKISKPSDIPRYLVHYSKSGLVPVTQVKDHAKTELLSGGKFMFSRDPYSRLWSAYIDKFHLPDFWRLFAKDVMKFSRPTATQAELTCPKDLSFHEFLLFVTGTKTLNEHWIPIHRICSPCHVDYDIIGHLETFSNDANYILNRYGHENLIEEIEPNKRARIETSMLIEYNFNIGTLQVFSKGCFENLEVAKRLWTAFQYNGYVHKNTTFPQNMNMTLFRQNPKREFLNQLDIVLENQRKQGVKLHTQRIEFMAKAYKSIPKDVLQKIKLTFMFDFELFGYDLEPIEIFG